MSASEDVHLVAGLARRLRDRVEPDLGSHTGRAHTGGGSAGDVTFAVDAAAEEELGAFVAVEAPGCAYFSEDRGLVAPADAERVLVVDPIDGTRPAMAGFEAACVSVALAPLTGSAPDGGPAMADVSAACVMEIKSGARFVAVRGRGLVADAPIRLSANTDLRRLFWTYGLRGRPARATMEVLGDLVDASSVGGATFELGSACFDLTRILTGQLDAYLEPGPRMVEEVPGMRAEFERVGAGAVLNNAPYDLAAAALCVSEGGALLTDAAGRPLDDRPLLGSGAEFQMSVVAAASPGLHAALVAEVDRGIERLAAIRA